MQVVGADSLVEPCALGVWPAAWPALKLAIANEYGARSVRPYVDSIRLCDVELSPFEIHACEEFWDGMSSSS